MPQVSRPLVAVLAASVVFLAVWMVALKPKPAGSGSANSPVADSAAISAAKRVAPGSPQAGSVTTAGSAGAAKAGGSSAASSTTSTTGAAGAAGATTGAHSAARPQHRVTPLPHSGAARSTSLPARVNAALIAHHAVVLFFYNPAGAEDRALLAELNHLSMPRGVLRASIPLSQLSQYPAITNAVQINQAATFVLVNTSGQASTIVGYTDPFELQTRIEQAAGVYGLASAFSASLKLPPPPTAAQIGQGAAGRLLAQSLSALARVRSFRMDADITGNGTHMRAIAVLGTRSTEFDITVTHGDQNLELIGLPVTSYVRANSAFWVAHGFGARVGSLSNRWIAAPTARLGKLGADVTGKGATELTRCAGQNLGTLSFAGSGSVNGQPVTVLRDAGDKPGSSPDLYEIAKRPPHLLLGIIGQGGTRPGGRISVCNDGQGGDWRGSGTFSQFGHPTPIAPPADALRPSLSIV